MTKDIPTAEDLNAAYEYALQKLCTEIPETVGEPGITKWDKNINACMVTEKGCQPEIRNPLSQPFFHKNGEKIEYSEDDPIYGEFWKIRPPGYYVMRTTKNSPDVPVCAPGNYLMQQWCEFPETRADKKVPGVTNVPPFKYRIENGVEYCDITQAYCHDKGVDYKDGDCFVPYSQKVAEFWSSTVLVRNAKRKKRASDIRLKKNIKQLRKDFPVKGVDIYIYEWNDVAHGVYGFSGYDFGLIADYIDPKYIEYDPLGYKVINMEYDDETMKRIKLFMTLKDEIILSLI
tara:strand:- start:65 stop:928 length:864 start_codon:yes stop_codon:yes gene_type:complete